MGQIPRHARSEAVAYAPPDAVWQIVSDVTRVSGPWLGPAGARITAVDAPWLLIKAHRDRSDALVGDLDRLARLAESEAAGTVSG